MASLVGSVLLAVCCYVVVVDSKQNRASQIMDLLSKNYSRNDAPSAASGVSTKVHIGVYINTLSIDEQKSKFSITMYFRQSWTDPRLAKSKSGPTSYENTILPEEGWNKIWLPDTFIRNSLSVQSHDDPSPQRLIKINEDGKIWSSRKLSAVLSSPMNFKRFPHDTQTLEMIFESFGHTADTFVIEALDSPVQLEPNIDLPAFTIVNTDKHDCSQNYTAGIFSCVKFSIVIHRNSGYYILAVYLPSIVFVILSWFVFWIDRDSSSVRLLTGVLLLITLNLTAVLTRSSAPHVSYITCLDVWFIVCHIFVFATLLEYLLVLVLSMKSAGLKGLKICTPPSQDKANADTGHDHSKGKQKALLLDWVSRILFPAVFLIFNLIYWISVARH